MAAHNELGKWGEQQAARFLEKKGYRILVQDWKDGHRDLDIVALNDHTIVIVEVKTRRNNLFAEPENAVDWRKVRSLSMAASKFVRMYRLDGDVRFDIITVIGDGEEPEAIHHIEDAFLPVRI